MVVFWLGCSPCEWSATTPAGLVNTTSAHTLAYGDFGWNMIPDFINSPQFLSLAISKSKRLLDNICPLSAIWVAAACLHNACKSLSNGLDQVAERPRDKLYESC